MTLGSETGWGGPGVRFKRVRRAAGEGPRGRVGSAVAQTHPTLRPPGGPESRAGRAGPAAGVPRGPAPWRPALPGVAGSYTWDLGPVQKQEPGDQAGSGLAARWAQTPRLG